MSVLLENGDVVHFDRGVRLSSRSDLYDTGASVQLIQISHPVHLVGMVKLQLLILAILEYISRSSSLH